jgi:hypothetical protein
MSAVASAFQILHQCYTQQNETLNVEVVGTGDGYFLTNYIE